MQTLGLGFTWEQLSAGQKFRTLNRTITETDLVMFVGVTGMVEVIFTDQTFGAEKGTIQGRFVPAALTYSLIEGLLCQSMIQGTGLAMLELNKKVLAPVRVGDTIHAEVEVTSVRPTSKGNRGIVASKIDVKNQNGEVVITYDATRMLAGRSERSGSERLRGLTGQDRSADRRRRSGAWRGDRAATGRSAGLHGRHPPRHLGTRGWREGRGRDQGQGRQGAASIAVDISDVRRGEARRLATFEAASGATSRRGINGRLGPRGEFPRIRGIRSSGRIGWAIKAGLWPV